MRGGEAPRVGGAAGNTWDALSAIAHRGLVTAGCRSFVRAFPLAGLAFVGTIDLSPNAMSVVTRSDDSRPIVAEFVEMARVVAAEFSSGSTEIRAVAAAPAAAD
jgi:hypothetical protein